jgi:hypothetical protein
MFTTKILRWVAAAILRYLTEIRTRMNTDEEHLRNVDEQLSLPPGRPPANTWSREAAAAAAKDSYPIRVHPCPLLSNFRSGLCAAIQLPNITAGAAHQ